LFPRHRFMFLALAFLKVAIPFRKVAMFYSKRI